MRHAKSPRRMGVPTHALAFDACDETQCTTLVAQAVAALGQLDVLINSAGIMGWSRAEDYPADMFDRVLKINLYGLFYVSRGARCRICSALAAASLTSARRRAAGRALCGRVLRQQGRHSGHHPFDGGGIRRSGRAYQCHLPRRGSIRQ